MSLYKSEDTLEQVTKSLQSWKKLIVDIYDDEYDNDENKENEKNGQLNVLQKYVEEYGQIEIDCEKTKAALQKLDEKLEEKEKPCEDVDGLYRECYDSLPEPSVNHYHDTRVWQAVFEGNRVLFFFFFFPSVEIINLLLIQYDHILFISRCNRCTRDS